MGAENPGDMLTKHVPRQVLQEHMHRCSRCPAEGRPESAPHIPSEDTAAKETSWTKQNGGTDFVTSFGMR